LPLVARNVMDGSAFLYGVLLGAFGIGAVAGAFVSAPLRARLSNEVLVRWTFVTFAICASITGTSTSPWLTSPALILGGAAWVITLSLFNFSVQLSTPRWVVGRAMSLYQMAIFGGMALGSWLWGVVAELYSPGTALLYASGAMLLGALVGFRIPLPDKQSLNLEPLNRWQQPDVRLDVRPQSGPVAINVEYDIAEQSLAEFLQLMELRHRIRRRDGAQQWTLLRDTENPDLWVEQFELPTWLDYIRFHQRTTQADAHVSDGIRALHRGDGLPKVRRMLIRDPTRSQIDEVVREPVDLQ
jgi:MFS family permease